MPQQIWGERHPHSMHLLVREASASPLWWSSSHAIGWAMPWTMGVVMYYCPTLTDSLVTTFDRTEIIKCHVFYCILHEIIYESIYSLMALFQNYQDFKFFWEWWQPPPWTSPSVDCTNPNDTTDSETSAPFRLFAIHCWCHLRKFRATWPKRRPYVINLCDPETVETVQLKFVSPSQIQQRWLCTSLTKCK